jgi:outer membrane protein TolC
MVMRVRWCLLAVLLLTACAATPYTRPAIACPAADAPPPDSWWRGFDDPQLLEVLREARSCNVDLAQSALLARRLRLEVERPDVDIKGSLGASRRLRPGNDGAGDSNVAQLSVAYELDLWGRLARARDARAWLAAAGEFDRQALELSLDAVVARAYWQRAALVQRLSLEQANLETQRQLLELVGVAVAAGEEAPRALWRQQQAWQQSWQQLSQLRRQAEDAKNILASLLDQPPGQSVAPSLSWFSGLPEIEADMSSALLARRPDVAAQEARLRQRLAELDLAQLDLMPVFSLTGLLGASSQGLAQIWSRPGVSGLASISFPFLDWKRLQLQRSQAQIDLQRESLGYRQTVHRALREVDQALALRQLLLADQSHLEQALLLAAREEAEAGLRLRQGESDRMALYRAQLGRRELLQRQLVLRLELLSNLADLYQAMGGAPGKKASSAS